MNRPDRKPPVPDAGCGDDAPTRTPPAHTGAGQRVTYRIENMDCPTEERLIRDKLAGVAGITGLDFNLLQRTLAVSHTLASNDPIESALKEIDMHARPAHAQTTPPSSTNDWHWPLLISGLAAVAAEIVSWRYGGRTLVVLALSLGAVAVGGWPTYRKGWIALWNRNLNINALMSIAVTGAMLIGEWPEAAMVMFLFALAELIEARSLDRARRAITGLLALAPETATVRQADGSWTEVAAKTVALDAVVRVRPGERIALDGKIIAGRSAVNQAPITGESLPVDKTAGDPVFAGTINQSGSFEYRVTAPANDSTLARIIHAVETAQQSRAPTQRFVDRFARIYTPTVFAVAVAAALLPPLAFGAAWTDSIYKALVLLVIACPCALVISTPVTIVSGLAAAARHGILIKGGVYLEEGRRLALVAFDKTGTLTHGRPAQTDFERLGDGDEKVLLTVARSLAARSDHPVSQAIARSGAPGMALQEVREFAAIPGRGVRGRIDGQRYQLGNHQLVEELGLCSAALEKKLDALERQGKTAVLLTNETRPLALFAVADTVKGTSRDAVGDLRALGIKTMILSGDNPHTVEAIARQVGIDEARGNLLPDDKLRAVELLTARGATGMVGDGVNDAPALARADIGFAMGAAGTDTAIETADVALMDDDLRKLPTFIRLSRATAAILKQNITLALGIKAVFLILALLGMATMWMAVFADMGASLLVVGNGLRLLRR